MMASNESHSFPVRLIPVTSRWKGHLAGGNLAGFFSNVCGVPWKHCWLTESLSSYKKDSIDLREPEETWIFKNVPKRMINWDHEEILHLRLIWHNKNHSPISLVSLWNHTSAYVKITGEYSKVFIVIKTFETIVSPCAVGRYREIHGPFTLMLPKTASSKSAVPYQSGYQHYGSQDSEHFHHSKDSSSCLLQHTHCPHIRLYILFSSAWSWLNPWQPRIWPPFQYLCHF